MASDQPVSPRDAPEFKQRRTVDLLCRKFEDEWRVGNQQTIEDVVSEAPEDVREELLPELIAIEWELNDRAGKTPGFEDYRTRFPAHQTLLMQLALVSHKPNSPAPSASTSVLPKTGDEFAGFRILRRLGSGGMGTVFLAEVPAISHPVALKILESSHQTNGLMGARFEREARLLSRLDHPGIVPLYTYGEHAGFQYLVMKAIPGACLATVMSISHSSAEASEAELQTHNLLAIAERINDRTASSRISLLLDLVRQLAEALRAVHSNGILHRDIKPSNILLTAAGHIFLTDFGLAREEQNDEKLTRGGEFVGTLRYAAPETLDGKYTPQSDLYSLGLVLFELFSQRIPFQSESRQELLRWKLSGNIPEMTLAIDWAPADVRNVVRRLTRSSPSERYQSAEELIEQLAICCKDRNERPPGTSNTRRWASLVIGILSVFLIVLLVRYIPNLNSAKARPADAGTISSGKNTSPLLVQQEKASDKSPYGNLPWLKFQHNIETSPDQPISQLAMNRTGTRLIALTEAGSLLTGDSKASDFTLIGGNSLRAIDWIALSDDGSCGLIVGRDALRPGINEAEHLTDSFVEAWSASDGQWVRIGGPPFKLPWVAPRFIDGIVAELGPFVLIPDAKIPTVWHPAGRGFVQVAFPGEDDRVAVAIHDFNAAAVSSNGKLEVLFYTQLDDNQEPVRKSIDTNLSECRVLRFSPDGQWILLVGTTEIALVSTQDWSVEKLEHQWEDFCLFIFSADSKHLVLSHKLHAKLVDVVNCAWLGIVTTTTPLILTSPLSSGPSILTVEQSGRIAETEFSSGEPRTKLEAQGPAATSAAFAEAGNCLAVAVKSGGVVLLSFQTEVEPVLNNATPFGADH